MAKSLITPGTTFEYSGGVDSSCVVFSLETETFGSGVMTSTGGDFKGAIKDITAGERTGLEGLVAQQVAGSIQKSTKQLYEIGSTRYYLVEGRPQGTGQVQHIIGPNSVDFWSQLQGFADVCRPTTLKVLRNPSCACYKGLRQAVRRGTNSPEQGTNYKQTMAFTGGFMNSLQVSGTAQDYVIMSNLGFMFFDLQADDATMELTLLT